MVRARYDFLGLKREALAKGLTQSQVARGCGATRQAVSFFFRGERVTPGTAKKIADFLEVDLHDYVIDDGTAPSEELAEVGR